jgi:predicted MFS family arabinose efflux permease
MNRKELNKYFTLLSLYLAQSIPMSFFSTVVPVIMRTENYSLTSIGLFQLLKLPWILKMFWAPYVDKTSSGPSQYRRWIIGSELFYALVIVLIGFFDLNTDIVTIVVLMLVAFVASATQDIATDAFAILILKEKERSLGNSMQSAGSFLGTMTGSGILLVIYHYWGWQNLLFCLAGFVVLALIPVMLRKTGKNTRPVKSKTNFSPFEFISFFRRKNIGGHVVLLFLFYSGIIGILTMVKPYLVDLGYNIKQIGFISGIFGTACGALMAIPAGLLIRKIGLVKSVWVFPVINLAAAVFFTFLTFTSHPAFLIYTGIGLLWSAYGMSAVFIYTLGMKMVRGRKEGTDFTIQIVITHLSSLILAILSGKIADAITYRGLFIIEILLGVFLLLLIPFIFKPEIYSGDENTATPD